MPIIEAVFVDNDGKAYLSNLIAYGPTITVSIGHFKSETDTSPVPKDDLSAHALVDTGATESCIDITLAEKLELPVVDKITISGVGGVNTHNVYMAQIQIPGLDIRYTPSVKFTGKSGYDHRFDFVVPKSKVQPERVVRTINRPNRNIAQAMAVSWIDIKDVRSPDARAYAILNDSEQGISENILDAMHSYEVQPVPWSARDAARNKFAA